MLMSDSLKMYINTYIHIIYFNTNIIIDIRVVTLAFVSKEVLEKLNNLIKIT